MGLANSLKQDGFNQFISVYGVIPQIWAGLKPKKAILHELVEAGLIQKKALHELVYGCVSAKGFTNSFHD